MDKQAIRKQAILARKNMTKEAWESKTKMIIDTFLRSSFFDQTHTIGLYMDIRQEVGTHTLIQYCFDHGIKVAVPKVLDDTRMKFYEIKSWDDLSIGHFNVLEPKQDIEVNTFDTILIPLVAFNEDKGRIGYGKGYYDRYLNDHPCLKIGLAFEIQKFDFQSERHDQPLDYIITESKVY